MSQLTPQTYLCDGFGVGCAGFVELFLAVGIWCVQPVCLVHLLLLVEMLLQRRAVKFGTLY